MKLQRVISEVHCSKCMSFFECLIEAMHACESNVPGSNRQARPASAGRGARKSICRLYSTSADSPLMAAAAVTVPRSPAHCIEYVHLIQWPQEKGGEEFDSDDDAHMQWVYQQALKRAQQYGIQARDIYQPTFVCKTLMAAMLEQLHLVSLLSIRAVNTLHTAWSA